MPDSAARHVRRMLTKGRTVPVRQRSKCFRSSLVSRPVHRDVVVFPTTADARHPCQLSDPESPEPYSRAAHPCLTQSSPNALTVPFESVQQLPPGYQRRPANQLPAGPGPRCSTSDDDSAVQTRRPEAFSSATSFVLEKEPVARRLMNKLFVAAAGRLRGSSAMT